MLKIFSRHRKNAIPVGPKGEKVRKRIFDEEACAKCGWCCYQTFNISGKYYTIPELPCKFLVKNGDGLTRCSVYPKRDKIDWCHYVNERNLKRGLFPRHCVYVQGIPDYAGKVSPMDIWPAPFRKKLRRIAKSMTKPAHINSSDWGNFRRSMELE